MTKRSEHEDMFSPKMEKLELNLFIFTSLRCVNVHYFLLANQSVWLSGQMRSSYTDKRSSPIFMW